MSDFSPEDGPIAPHDPDFLRNLIVGIGEVAEITRIPARQIRYWEEKGYVRSLSAEGKNRRYDYYNIKKMLLIKELLDEGYTLEASVRKVENRIRMLDSAFGKLGNRGESTGDPEE